MLYGVFAMRDAHRISEWYRCLGRAEKLNLKLLMNTQTDAGTFCLSKGVEGKMDKEIYTTSDIFLMAAFVDGLSFNTL